MALRIMSTAESVHKNNSPQSITPKSGRRSTEIFMDGRMENTQKNYAMPPTDIIFYQPGWAYKHKTRASDILSEKG